MSRCGFLGAGERVRMGGTMSRAAGSAAAEMGQLQQQQQSWREQAENSLSKFIAGAVEENLDTASKLRGKVQGVGTEVEVIHKMRVKWRRLRTIVREVKGLALSTCTVPKAKEISAFLRLLGSSRDLDVQIELLQVLEDKYINEDSISAPALSRLHKREAKIKKIRDEAMGSGSTDMSKKIVKTSKKLEKTLHSWISRVDDDSTSCQEAAPELQCLKLDVLMRMQGWRVTEPVELGTPDMEVMHSLRKAFKELRYQMELFHPIYTDGYPEQAHAKAIALVVEGSEILGKLQDAEMLMDAQRAWLKKNSEVDKALDKYVSHYWAKWLWFATRFQAPENIRDLESVLKSTQL